MHPLPSRHKQRGEEAKKRGRTRAGKKSAQCSRCVNHSRRNVVESSKATIVAKSSAAKIEHINLRRSHFILISVHSSVCTLHSLWSPTCILCNSILFYTSYSLHFTVSTRMPWKRIKKMRRRRRRSRERKQRRKKSLAIFVITTLGAHVSLESVRQERKKRTNRLKNKFSVVDLAVTVVVQLLEPNSNERGREHRAKKSVFQCAR